MDHSPLFFQDRFDAGRRICSLLQPYLKRDSIVFALPRGGVPVAAEIASFLKAPLNLLFAHKIGHPLHREYAIAAMTESGRLLFDREDPRAYDPTWLEEEKRACLMEMRSRRKLYNVPKITSLKGKVAIAVDDGIATGLTMRAAILELRSLNPEAIVVAVPVAPLSQMKLLQSLTDDAVAPIIPDDDFYLGSVGCYYHSFPSFEDEEVIALLHDEKRR